MITLGIYQEIDKFSILDSLLLALLAMLIVFAVLVLIIIITSIINIVMQKIDAKTQILPREENKILSEDEDAVVAALVATLDFHKEFNSDARLVSIEKVED